MSMKGFMRLGVPGLPARFVSGDENYEAENRKIRRFAGFPFPHLRATYYSVKN
jgi:hypothetical protein